MFTSTLLNPCLSPNAIPCKITTRWLRGNPVCSRAFASALKTVSDYSLREQELIYRALFPNNSNLFHTGWTYNMDSLWKADLIYNKPVKMKSGFSVFLCCKKWKKRHPCRMGIRSHPHGPNPYFLQQWIPKFSSVPAKGPRSFGSAYPLLFQHQFFPIHRRAQSHVSFPVHFFPKQETPNHASFLVFFPKEMALVDRAAGLSVLLFPLCFWTHWLTFIRFRVGIEVSKFWCIS